MQSEPVHDRKGLIARFESGDCAHRYGWKDSIAKLSAAKMADLFIQRFPALARETLGSDWSYAGRYQEMLMRTSPNVLPIAYCVDEYEAVVCDVLRLHQLDQANQEHECWDMPLTPLYKHAGQDFTP